VTFVRRDTSSSSVAESKQATEITVYYFDTPVVSLYQDPRNMCGHISASTPKHANTIKYFSFAGMPEEALTKFKTLMAGTPATVGATDCSLQADQDYYGVMPIKITLQSVSDQLLDQAENNFNNGDREKYSVLKNNCAHNVLKFIHDAGLVAACETFYAHPRSSVQIKKDQLQEQIPKQVSIFDQALASIDNIRTVVRKRDRRSDADQQISDEKFARSKNLLEQARLALVEELQEEAEDFSQQQLQEEQKLELLHKKSKMVGMTAPTSAEPATPTSKWALRPKQVAVFCCFIALMQIEMEREAIRLEATLQDNPRERLKRLLANDIKRLNSLKTYAQVKRDTKLVDLLEKDLKMFNDYRDRFYLQETLPNESAAEEFVYYTIIPGYQKLLSEITAVISSKSMRFLFGKNDQQILADYSGCIDLEKINTGSAKADKTPVPSQSSTPMTRPRSSSSQVLLSLDRLSLGGSSHSGVSSSRSVVIHRYKKPKEQDPKPSALNSHRPASLNSSVAASSSSVSSLSRAQSAHTHTMIWSPSIPADALTPRNFTKIHFEDRPVSSTSPSSEVLNSPPSSSSSLSSGASSLLSPSSSMRKDSSPGSSSQMNEKQELTQAAEHRRCQSFTFGSNHS